MLLLTSPHNPTGRLYSSKALLAAVAWARKRSLHIVVDEVRNQASFAELALRNAFGMAMCRRYAGRMWQPTRVFGIYVLLETVDKGKRVAQKQRGTMFVLLAAHLRAHRPERKESHRPAGRYSPCLRKRHECTNSENPRPVRFNGACSNFFNLVMLYSDTYGAV